MRGSERQTAEQKTAGSAADMLAPGNQLREDYRERRGLTLCRENFLRVRHWILSTGLG